MLLFLASAYRPIGMSRRLDSMNDIWRRCLSHGRIHQVTGKIRDGIKVLNPIPETVRDFISEDQSRGVSLGDRLREPAAGDHLGLTLL